MENYLTWFVKYIKKLKLIDREDYKHLRRFRKVIEVVLFGVLIGLLKISTSLVKTECFKRKYAFENKYLIPLYFEPFLFVFYSLLMRISAVLITFIVVIEVYNGTFFLTHLILCCALIILNFVFVAFAKKAIRLNKINFVIRNLTK